MSVGKTRSLPYSGAHAKCFTQVGSGLTFNQLTKPGLNSLAYWPIHKLRRNKVLLIWSKINGIGLRGHYLCTTYAAR
jgi:hypothetical protein